MDFVISLAHFCETHGPTTVLCTQLSPVSCSTCFPSETPASEDLSNTNSSSYSSHGHGLWDSSSPQPFTPITAVPPGLTSPIFTTSPPRSPRSPSSAFNPYFGNHTAAEYKAYTRRLSFGSDSTENDSCNSCNFLVPKQMLDSMAEGKESAESSGTASGEGSVKANKPEVGPVLRTTSSVVAYAPNRRKFCFRTYDDEEDEDEDDEDDDDTVPRLSTSPASQASASESSSRSGSGSSSSLPHRNRHRSKSNTNHSHSLTYVTRRQPESQSVYSRLRHSCIRTLSSEQLPRGSASGVITFGDPIAGFTIARIFRLPDPRARGRRRTYALTALGRYEWRVMEAFVQVTRAFERIADRIVSMADEVLDREAASMGLSGRLSPTLMMKSPTSPIFEKPGSTTIPMGTSAKGKNAASASPVMLSSVEPAGSPTVPLLRHPLVPGHSRNSSLTGGKPDFADVSSFLMAKKVDPEGYPRFMSRDWMVPKGLNEIVGDDNFFVELHASFCVILHSLVTGLR